MNTAIAKRINNMAAEDRATRRGHRKGVKLDARADKRHAAELKRIIARYGWPTIPLVGKKASNNAWLLVQHADHDKKFQRFVLRLLEEIDAQSCGKDIKRINIAYLTDRLLVGERKKQRFGTQFDFARDGRMELHPVRDLAHVNALRREYGLPPLRAFLKMAEEYNARLLE